MHDLDRTYLEDAEGPAFTGEDEDRYGEDGYGEDRYGEDRYGEDGYGEDYHAEDEGYRSGEIFHEDEVTEMAAELLGVSSEHELDHFLGDLVKSVTDKLGGLAGRFLGKAQGQQLAGMLKSLAPTALRSAASALLPGAGGAIAGLIGLELEGLSPEDQEFEAAKQFVRLGADAIHRSLGAPDDADPRMVAQTALTGAMEQYAPGLLHGAPDSTALAPAMQRRSGRWYLDRGRIIIDLGGAF